MKKILIIICFISLFLFSSCNKKSMDGNSIDNNDSSTEQVENNDQEKDENMEVANDEDEGYGPTIWFY